MSFQVFANDIKEEPEWEDYCISEAQAREAARSGRGVKLEPGSEPPSSITGAPETGCKIGDSINSNSSARKSIDTENNDSVKEENVKEESEENSWLQQLTGLYEDTDNNDEPKLRLDPLPGTSEKIEINRKSEEPNAVSSVLRKTEVVNTRKDLMLINNIAQEVNQKNVLRPVIVKYLVTPRQQPVIPAKNNPVLKKPDVCKKVVTNPEIGLLSQPSMANQLLISNVISLSDSVKKQSSNSVPQVYNQTVPFLNSVAYNNSAISKQSPRPCPVRRATKTTKQPLPRGIFQPINGVLSRPLPKGIIRPIILPITQLKGKVSVKLLKNLPSKTTTSVQNLQTGTISKLKPGAVTKFQPGNIHKLQPGIEPKLQSNTALASKTYTLNSQAGPPNLGSANIVTLRPPKVPSFLVKIVPTSKSVNPASIKSVTEVTQLFNKPIIGNRCDSVKSIHQKVPGNDKSLVSDNTSTSGSLKTIITATPTSKPTPTIPSNYVRIALKPIPKVISSQIPKAVERNLIFKYTNGHRQSVKTNDYVQIEPSSPKTHQKSFDTQIARQIDNDKILQSRNDDQSVLTQNSKNVQTMAPKTVPKVPGPVNSQISKSIDNDIIRQSINDERRMVTQNSNVQPMAPKTVPKDPGPVNSQISKSIDNDIIRQSINDDRRMVTQNSNVQTMAPKTVPIVPEPLNSQITKSIDNDIIRQSINDDRRMVTQNSNVQPMAPKTVPKVPEPLNSQISQSIDNDIIPQATHDDRQVGTQNLPTNSNKGSEPSDKVVNLEDFLKPCYVVLERLKETSGKGGRNTSNEPKDPEREKPVLNLGNEGAIRKCDDRDTTRIICKYCQRGFYRYNLLYLHIQRDHLGIKKKREFHCDYCGKICTDTQNIVNHIRTHTGEKPFTCSICNTHHRTASNLVSHNLNVHSRKKHSCPNCGKKFSLMSNMTRHLKTHSGDRPHVCTICDKRFIEKHHLTRHLEDHSGVKRYVCDICEMRFSRNFHLERHIKNIHMKRPKRRIRRVRRVKS